MSNTPNPLTAGELAELEAMCTGRLTHHPVTVEGGMNIVQMTDDQLTAVNNLWAQRHALFTAARQAHQPPPVAAGVEELRALIAYHPAPWSDLSRIRGSTEHIDTIFDAKGTVVCPCSDHLTRGHIIDTVNALAATGILTPTQAAGPRDLKVEHLYRDDDTTQAAGRQPLLAGDAGKGYFINHEKLAGFAADLSEVLIGWATTEGIPSGATMRLTEQLKAAALKTLVASRGGEVEG